MLFKNTYIFVPALVWECMRPEGSLTFVFGEYVIVHKFFNQIPDFKPSTVTDLFAFLTPKINELKWIKSPL